MVNLSSGAGRLGGLEGFQKQGDLIACVVAKKTGVLVSGSLQSPEGLNPVLRGKHGNGEFWAGFKNHGDMDRLC